LKKLQGFNVVLIGGYVVSSYTQPRFSVDCDIVVQNKESAEKVKNILIQEGYKEKKINPNIPYGGEFLCLVKRIDNYAIPFDVLIGSVIDRNTKNKFPAEWVFQNSEKRTLVGKANPIKIELNVAKPEILIVMKLAASRKSDFRDIFMLLEGKVDIDYVLSELKKYKLQDNLKTFKEYVTSNNFEDSLQGVFGKVDQKLFEKLIEKTLAISSSLGTQ